MRNEAGLYGEMRDFVHARTILLPEEDFTVPSALFLTDPGDELLAAGQKGKICRISPQSDDPISVLDPAAYHASYERRLNQLQTDDVRDMVEIAENLFNNIPGMYLTDNYDLGAGEIRGIRASSDSDGVTARITAITNHGFLFDWRRGRNGTFNLQYLSDMTGTIAFANAVSVIPNGDIAYSDTESGNLHIVRLQNDGIKERDFVITLPPVNGHRQLILTHSAVPEKNGLRIVAGTSHGNAYLMNIDYDGDGYSLQNMLAINNPTEPLLRHLESTVLLSHAHADPRVLAGPVKQIAFINDTAFIACYLNGFARFDIGNGGNETDFEIVKFGYDEVLRSDLGGCGRPVAVCPIPDGRMAAAYEFGRVAVWSQTGNSWNSEIIRKHERNGWVHGMQYGNDSLYVLTQEQGTFRGAVEIYSFK